MFAWLLRKFEVPRPQCTWSVVVTDGVIRTSDGVGTSREVPIGALASVAVATDDSGPWDYDVVFLLYADGFEPTGIFPLEADGCQEFVRWLSNQSGYRDRELAKAMASTNVARFLVYQRE
jgi:hypothetical protein